MNIDTKELREKIERQQSRLLGYEQFVRDAPLDPHEGEPTVAIISMNAEILRVRNIIRIDSLLLMAEEKRRLLETIIGWMTMAVYIPHQKGTIFIDGILDNFSALVEIHKRVGFAKTIDELDQVSNELTKFSEKHPELRNN